MRWITWRAKPAGWGAKTTGLPGLHPARQASRRRARRADTEPLLCRAAATPCPAYGSCTRLARHRAAGQGERARSRFYAGRRRRLARPTVRAACR
ncbi:hypothetical protein CWN40_08490 [Klebsiella quasipneumoniae]|nr:hypothetical protein CWN41_04640 [Klebsiella quasipneumoniae]PLM38012.1 hypothetical protein CWN40_08490 [Klebsiella quasipneumoniae]